MNFKVIILLVVFSVAVYARPGKLHNKEHEHEQSTPDDGEYSFNYKVDDSSSENDYGHQEKRSGGRTEGEYYVRLPDSRLMKVKYYVDGDSGFVSQVEYEGEAKF